MNYKKYFIKNHFIEILLSLPKTVYFNFKVLPLRDALRMPFIVSYHVKLEGVNRRSFMVNSTGLKTASMRVGFGDSLNGIRESKEGLIYISPNGKIVVGKDLGLCQGCVLICRGANLTLGDRFRCNYSTTIDCTKEDITIGDDVGFGWNVTVKNNDGHTVISQGISQEQSKPIIIGNHVWICAFATVLKGVHICDDSIVAYGSLLTKTQESSNLLYGGSPAKIIRENVNWRE